jgi:hydrogenase maturation protease
VGNPARSDDAVGPLIAEALGRRPMPVPVHLSSGEPGELLDLWSHLQRVVVVDAVVTGKGRPGTIHVLNASTDPLPVLCHASSHGIGVAESIELARSLHQLPPDVRLVGIEVGSLQPGTALTAEVRRAIPDAVAQVLVEIHHA